MINRRQTLKLLVVLAFSLVWFAIDFGKARQAVSQVGLDQAWLMSLAHTFHQGSVSGRDFQFTYGPVAQILAWLGAGHMSAFEAYPLMILVWHVTSIVLFGAIVLCIRGLGPAHTALIYLAVGALDLFGAPPAFRMLLVLLASVAVGRALTSVTEASRRIWSALAGTLCFVGQLTTLELGPYAMTAAALLCLGYIVRARLSGEGPGLRGPGETLLMLWCIYIGGNLLLSAFFRLTGEHYSFFDYQRYAFEMMRGYTYGMGMPWGLNRWRTAGLMIITGYTVVEVWLLRGRLNASDQPVLFGMTAAALVCQKSMLIRSGTEHIVLGMTPMVTVFLALGQWVLPDLQKSRTYWKHPIIWICGVLLLFSGWPTKATAFAYLKLAATSWSAGGFSALRSPTPPENVLPAAVADALRGDSSKPILNFPYDNHIGILVNRRLVAPVLQAHNAGTVALQQYYVESLQRAANGDSDVTYSVDKMAAWPVDGVQTISRVPIIFEYLYRNFELRERAGGLLVLRRSREPRRVTFCGPAFQITASRGLSEVRLSQPTNCGLVRLQIQIDYPLAAVFLRPARLGVTVVNQGAAITYAAFVPITTGKPFYTFLSVVPPEEFFRMFGHNSIPSPVWDGLVVAADAPDWLATPPHRFRISRLECVDGERFIPVRRDAPASAK